MLLTVGAFIWFIVVGVDYVRDSKRESAVRIPRGSALKCPCTGDGLSSRLSTMLLVQGILFLSLAAFEAFGFYVAYKVRAVDFTDSLRRS